LYLLKRENIGAQSHAVAFVTLDGFGDIRDRNPRREFHSSEVVVVDSDESGVVLAEFEPEIVGEIVSQPNDPYGVFRRHPLLSPRQHLFTRSSPKTK